MARTASAPRLYALDEVCHASAVASGHTVHLVHDEHLPLRVAVEGHGAVGHHLLDQVRALRVKTVLHIRLGLAEVIGLRLSVDPGNQAFEGLHTFPRVSLALTSMISNASAAQMILAELVLPIPGGPEMSTAFLGASFDALPPACSD